MILISHDLGVVAGIADRVLVMYAGKAVEVGGVDAVFAQPRMPYTAGLLASLPSLEHRKDRLTAIRGHAAFRHRLRGGLRFRAALPDGGRACAGPAGPGAGRACARRRLPFRRRWRRRRGQRPGRLRDSPSRPTAAPRPTAPPGQPARREPDGTGEPVLVVTDLMKHFQVRGASFRSVATVQAVSGVNLELRAGQCLALVGESGCGKSTLARLLVRLEEPTSGSITLNGRELTG